MMKNLLKKFVPKILINWYHFVLAFLGAVFYRFPSRKLKVIGITGTNGKTTTVELTERIFEEVGCKVASVNSMKFKIGKEERENKMRMTMPGRFFLQRFLRRALNANCDYALLEVTSEGIKQHRHRFINFEIAAITNLAPEHIEAHGSFENYRRAKGKLFEATKKIHVLNLDDENFDYFSQFQGEKKYGYRIRGTESFSSVPKMKNSLIKAKDIEVSDSGTKFSIKDTIFDLKLLSKFNIYNALAAISIAKSQGINLRTCKKALEKVKEMPGRMEIVIERPFKVIVDYAFTPNALREVYRTIRENFSPKKMICVFGACGGGRDKWKRPVLGKIATNYCQKIILTNEDPYDEDPKEILSQIKLGIQNSKFEIQNLYQILDRREAIVQALSLAKRGDVIIITGKGCEPSICLAGGRQILWDDRKVVKQEFKRSVENLLYK